MGFLTSSPPPICPSQSCSQWVRVHLKYCLCNAKNGVALSLGLLSVLSWGVAEVPQIITTYKTKSTEGLSMVFLVAWLIGDVLNLVGCILEPATLPTQFFMALLYTVTTLVLASQTIYYGHLYHRLKSNRSEKHETQQDLDDRNESGTDHAVTRNDHSHDSGSGKTSPIPVAIQRYSGGRVYYYYLSTGSPQSRLAMARSSRRTSQLGNQQPPPLLAHAATQPAPVIQNMLSIVPLVFFLVNAFSLWSSAHSGLGQSSDGFIIPVGRKLLQLEDSGGNGEGSKIGTYLGWAMTAIYMGGRLPQIYLNIKRGNAEGLNPLMFSFALVGNSTYVGSILVNSTEWSKIRPNLPWLVDSAGCVVLDSFIMLQFLYFHLRSKKGSDQDIELQQQQPSE